MEILSQETYAVLGGNFLLDGLLILSAMAAALILIGAFLELSDGSVSGFLVSVVCLIAFSVLTYFSYGWATEYQTKYKVTIDDFNEVHDGGYEIVDQEGDIYTVIKKEDE